MLLGGLLEPGADLLQLLVAFGELEDAVVELAGPRSELILGLGDPALQPRDLVPACLHVLLRISPDLRSVDLGVFDRLAEGLGGVLL